MRQYLDLKKRLDTSAWLVEADSRPATPAEIEHSLTWISFAYVLALAAWGKTHLSILDWGGGIGTYRNLARALGPSVDLEYHVRELPGVVRAAAGLAPDVTFHDNDADALARQYNLIVASSSLHYARDWSATLGSLANACQEYLYVARQPVVWHVPSFVVGQRPPGYADPYPGWFLNQSHLLSAAADCGLRLERAFVLAEAPFVPGAPEQSEYRAYLFRRSA